MIRNHAALFGISLSLIISVVWANDIRALPDGAPTRQINLPNGLQEISGLAVASENSVYAHNDEFAIIYEIDLETGEVPVAFAMGDPTARGDFEGITTANGRVYLITSTGLIYESPIGAHRQRVRFNIYDTGTSDLCEVEGLTTGPTPGEFLILCKTALQPELTHRLIIYRWNIFDRSPVTGPWLSIPYTELLEDAEFENFRPSAIERNHDDNSFVILSARNGIFLVLESNGALASKRRLRRDVHPQAEGVAIMPSGELIIADEGAKRGVGKLAIFNHAD